MTVECIRCEEGAEDQTTECPKCGYNPAKKYNAVALVFLVLGGGISLTGVGAVIGLPGLLIGGYLFYKGSKSTVETSAPY